MIFDWKTETYRYRYYLTNLKELGKRKDVGSFAELTATLFVISFFILFAIRPTFIIISGLMKEIKEKEEISNQLQQKVVALRMAQEEYSKNMSRLYLVDQALPEKPDFPLLIFAVEQEARSANAQMISFSITKIGIKTNQVSKSKTAKVPFFDFNSTLTGDYQNLKEFLGKMENLRRVIEIDSINFTKTKKTEKEASKIKLSITGKVNFQPKEVEL